VGEVQPAAGQAPVTAEVTARRFRVASPGTGLVLGALIIVLVALDVLLGHVAHGGGAGLWFVALLIAALGLVVARRQPANPLGWLLMGFSVWVAVYDSAGAYAVWDYHFHHGSLPFGPAAVLVASELWIVMFLMLPLVILLFPDGRLPSRWRIVLWAYLAICALLIAALLDAGAWQIAGTRIVVTGKGQMVSNPGPSGAVGVAFVILLAAVPVFWASFVARQVLSWRQATGERRAQLKWLMASGALTVAGLAGGSCSPSLPFRWRPR
jgi:two-component system, NarL family, sensor kinase